MRVGRDEIRVEFASASRRVVARERVVLLFLIDRIERVFARDAVTRVRPREDDVGPNRAGEGAFGEEKVVRLDVLLWMEDGQRSSLVSRVKCGRSDAPEAWRSPA